MFGSQTSAEGTANLILNSWGSLLKNWCSAIWEGTVHLVLGFLRVCASLPGHSELWTEASWGLCSSTEEVLHIWGDVLQLLLGIPKNAGAGVAAPRAPAAERMLTRLGNNRMSPFLLLPSLLPVYPTGVAREYWKCNFQTLSLASQSRLQKDELRNNRLIASTVQKENVSLEGSTMRILQSAVKEIVFKQTEILQKSLVSGMSFAICLQSKTLSLIFIFINKRLELTVLCYQSTKI